MNFWGNSKYAMDSLSLTMLFSIHLKVAYSLAMQLFPVPWSPISMVIDLMIISTCLIGPKAFIFRISFMAGKLIMYLHKDNVWGGKIKMFGRK
jgi:hypothetical protein